ncbi:hypothetical protein HZF05_15505 [Sphingomonas sp. CGMCC 1.13654]|uniref:Uncharacterized protein n=1 Tax=Sphingomonas chungangi TaxID=2683589 RepID=A0A838L7N1_9SPHN|nr:hypothetical protein [Sphingomonas chungangi]MBA2935493.1 hypothetical protein [Sphingomonas chungangi]MVW57000.1 hypothetical protein [Sphingomonas chungangi]
MLFAALAMSTVSPTVSTFDPDLRCVAVFSYAETKVDASAQAGITAGLMYYYGRLDGRHPGYDMEGEMRKLTSAGYDAQSVQADLQRCGGDMQRKGEYLQQIGRALEGKTGTAP